MAAIIAAKRAEIQAKLAQFQPPGGAQTQPAAAAPGSLPAPSRPPVVPAGPLGSSAEIQRKIAEAKGRLLAVALRNKAMQQIPTEPPRPEEIAGPSEPRASGGLHIKPPPGMVLDGSGNLDLKGMMAKGLIPKPNFATAKANQRPTPAPAKKELKLVQPSPDFTDTTKNPYYDPSLATTAAAAPRSRVAKGFKFNQPGKYVNQANQLRAKQQLEKLKLEIAASVRKAGMEVDLDVSDKSIKKDPPPSIEWWDVPLLPNKTYEDLGTGAAQQRLESGDSLVTLYVQHPVPIQPPADPGAPTPRPLMLTKSERKKLRRQRRLELQKEKQDKIRLGLLPPEQPKVKLSNLMRVLGQEAIQDPTAIETRVRREMEQRKSSHEQANAERKLSEEAAREKKKRKLVEDTSKVVEVAVFKITNLTHRKHKYKVDTNAQQLKLTGCAILNRKCNLVIAEGGPKGIKAYKKLMLRRIDWEDMEKLNDETVPDVDDAGGVKPMEADEETKGPNRCLLVWEGEVKERAFRGFRFRVCESERAAREVLGRAKVEHYWDAATAVDDEELALRQPVL
ncbi:PRP3-domain-containing protein [Jimgerdemannia flammicorona]|uniref:PRP3-domain-containing protein n=1 Tax=Jimgerdemannia flammicorona TaxID=994334 RepID=A0A433D3K5_9FUNG|nr:PRP3-domain-containing protein [Jimgerdemannia flammicorona]